MPSASRACRSRFVLASRLMVDFLIGVRLVWLDLEHHCPFNAPGAIFDAFITANGIGSLAGRNGQHESWIVTRMAPAANLETHRLPGMCLTHYRMDPSAA